MAVIRRVVYTELPGQAKDLREKAGQLNTELHTIYKRIDGMKSCWQGKRYDSLVLSFNNMIPALNDIVDLMYREVPSLVETVANNYSNVDTGSNITTVDNSGAQRLDNIPLSNAPLKFDPPTDVEAIKTDCNSRFNTVLGYLDELETKITNLSWESDASDAFRLKFKSLKSKIGSDIEVVRSEFEKRMQETLMDMQATESANTVQQ